MPKIATPFNLIFLKVILMMCMAVSGLPSYAQDPIATNATQSKALALLTTGIAAEHGGLLEDAKRAYTAAYSAAKEDLTLSQDDLLRIEEKYTASLLASPTEHRRELSTYAKITLLDESVSSERTLLAWTVAQALLHRDMKYPVTQREQVVGEAIRELSAPMPPWDSNTQGAFIMSMAAVNNEIAIGTEDTGVWIYNQQSDKSQHFMTKDGLGDDDAYALAYDRLGRLWVGHLNHGVSVYNGVSWKNYGPADGPIGSRVFAITTSPIDGDVWIATDSGLTRYSLSKDRWRTITMADKLPSNQITCLAFDRKGNLYLGTACDGVAIAAARDNYAHWRRVIGPTTLPNSAHGTGIPSNLINALAVTSNGLVWVGTTCGLARSNDCGATWTFQRGEDWLEKIRGLQHPPAVKSNPGTDLLLEDYVTCLTEGGDGNLYIGYRQKNYEIRNPRSGARLYPQSGDSVTTLYLSTLLPLASGNVLLARYGDGVRQETPFAGGIQTDHFLAFPKTKNQTHITRFPTPVSPPSTATIQNMIHQVHSLKKSPSVLSACYLGPDWETQGDWVGRYGRQYARLCAMDHTITWSSKYDALGSIGPHHTPGDGLRSWVHWPRTENERCLYTPVLGYRRQADYDDHGEDYAQTFEGPDVWITVRVPTGYHQVSLYFMNKDGHDGSNRCRDYIVEVRRHGNPETVILSPPLAQARVRDFWGGVYHRFMVNGPGQFDFRIRKNNSFNTIISGVMIDALHPTQDADNDQPMAWMNGVMYNPPQLPKKFVPNSAALTQAMTLWRELDNSKVIGNTLDYPYRVFAYRAAKHNGAPSSILSQWRWKLKLWTEEDKRDFDTTMEQARQSDATHVANAINNER